MESIFKTYDIRGISGSEITEETMEALGFAFGELTKERKDIHSPIILGRDGRLHSEVFAKNFIKGLTENGVDVIDIGLCTTPMLSFAIMHLKTGGGVMITASHNPKYYNGIKMHNKHGLNLSPKKEAKSMELFFISNKLKKSKNSDNLGKTIRKDILDEYISFILNKIKINSNLRIIADLCNGVARIPFQEIIKNLSLSVELINEEIDGNFPGHEPDPGSEESLKEIRKKVIERRADLGVIFDGDADRIGFIDEKGVPIPADIMGCIISDYLLKKNSGSEIVSDILCTKNIKEIAESNNSKSIISKVGRYHIISEMIKNERAIFGFEKSGHFYHRDFFGLDNAMLSFLLVLKILEESKTNLSELAIKYQKYINTPVINLKTENPDECLKKIKETFSNYKIVEIDGVTIESNDFRFTIRKSNTEPLIRIAGEASNLEKLEEIKEKILKIIG